MVAENNFLGNGQAQAGAAQGPGTGFFNAIKALKQMGQMLWWDADARIPKNDLNAGLSGDCLQADFTSNRSVLHSIIQEVQKQAD